MDATDYIQIPSFKSTNTFKRRLYIAAGTLTALAVLEHTNGVVSRSVRSLKRGCSAALAAWLEDHGGVKLFTVEGDEPPPFTPADNPSSPRAPWLPDPEAQQGAAQPNDAADAGGEGEGEATPEFFQSTKFFACLELAESQKLFQGTSQVRLPPGEVLFQEGDASESGIFIVVGGALGVYLLPGAGEAPVLTNTLRYGESVGDLDVVDGAPRSVTCAALDKGCLLVQVPRALFLDFVLHHPHTLQLYLMSAIARLWRVAHFTLQDFLQLDLNQPSPQPHTPSAATPCAPPPPTQPPPTPASPTAATFPSNPPSASAPSPFEPPASPSGSATPPSPAALLTAPPPTTSSPTAAAGAPSHSPPPASPTGAQRSPSAAQQAPARLPAQHSGGFLLGARACLADGWDVVSWEEASLDDRTLGVLQRLGAGGMPGRAVGVTRGQVVVAPQQACGQMLVVQAGHLLAERREGGAGGRVVSAVIGPGSLVSAAAFLTSTATRCHVIAATSARIVLVGVQQLEALAAADPAAFVALLVASARALRPVVTRFLSLGLNRVWLRSGDTAFRQGADAESLYLVISGRLRLLRTEPHPVSSRPTTRPEEEVGRGEAVGAVWALSGGPHDTTALCVRDSELVRMSRAAFRSVAAHSPSSAVALMASMARRLGAASSQRRGVSRAQTPGSVLPQGGASSTPDVGRLRGEVVTVALVPAGCYSGLIAAAAVAAAHGGATAEGRRWSGDGGSLRGGSARSSIDGGGADEDDEGRGDGGSRAWEGEPLSAQPPLPGGRTRRSPDGKPHHNPGGQAVRRLSEKLKSALGTWGPVLRLSSGRLQHLFPSAMARLSVQFYRSKITGWMAAQEEEYRFILLEAGDTATDWSRVCLDQADCVLLVAPEGAAPKLGEVERALIWRQDPQEQQVARPAPAGPPAIRWPSLSAGMGESSKGSEESLASAGGPSPAWGGAGGLEEFGAEAVWGSVGGRVRRRTGIEMGARLLGRRVELVLLHEGGSHPDGTSSWLTQRPLLTRHHHVRPTHPPDVARLARWVAGRTTGLVLSGGGSRGLAHLGILSALQDLGVPVDAIGGTSQGAFMAGLFAQGLSNEVLQAVVRQYAERMGSARHLLADLTLPLLSLFSGHAFDSAVQQAFSHGPAAIEDLWVPYFCITTNLTKGEASTHSTGPLARLVRASMTIVGLLPPAWVGGELLVDGGYINNVPVDVMRGLGVDTVIVVDVEEKEAGGWQQLTPYDGGLSGWRLLWERWCPIPFLRSNVRTPRYRHIISQLTWLAHTYNLKRVAADNRIDLYLRPPNISAFKLLDYHLFDRIVRDSYTYAWAAVSKWSSRVRQEQAEQGQAAAAHPPPKMAPLGTNMRRSISSGCMTQLQQKHQLQHSGRLPAAAGTTPPEALGGLSRQLSLPAPRTAPLHDAAPYQTAPPAPGVNAAPFHISTPATPSALHHPMSAPQAVPVRAQLPPAMPHDASVTPVMQRRLHPLQLPPHPGPARHLAHGGPPGSKPPMQPPGIATQQQRAATEGGSQQQGMPARLGSATPVVGGVMASHHQQQGDGGLLPIPETTQGPAAPDETLGV